MKRNKKIKHSVISKLYNLTTLNVLGPKNSNKYLSVLDRHCKQWGLHVNHSYKLLVLTAATGLCHTMVKIKNKHMQYMHIAKYCTLGSTISTGGSHFLLLQSF